MGAAGPIARRFVGEHARQLERPVEISHEQQVFDMADRGSRNLAPPLGALFDREQIEEKFEIEHPDLGGSDRRDPLANPVRRIVGNALDLERLGSAPESSRA
jgi:hypothetical protein